MTFGESDGVFIKCEHCNGTGMVYPKDCPDCEGIGLSTEKISKEILVPSTATSGRFEVENEGHEVRGFGRGKLKVSLNVEKHPDFELVSG